MKVGIIGNHGSGKTTIFKALTGLEEHHRELTGVGVVEVPDERLDKLHLLYPDRKKTLSRIDIIDAGVFEAKNELIRTIDAYLLVIGAFYGDEPVHIWNDLKADMIIADQDVIEKRLKRIEKEHRSENKAERNILKRALKILKEGKLLIKSPLEEYKAIRGYNFFTFKPVFAVININEEQNADDFKLSVKELEIPYLVFSGKIEAEIQEIGEEERDEYMELYGVEERAIGRLVRKLYSAIGLVTFFTIGNDEIRGWRLRENSTVLEAAGKIHTDMERGFIKAEMISIDEFLKAGGEKEAREGGLFNLVGKDYIVKDGDILKIRFA